MKKNIWPVCIVLATLAVYAGSVRGEFIWEDWGQVADNPMIRSLANIPLFFFGGTYFEQGSPVLWGSLYRPLMMVYYAGIAALFGVHPLPFHAVQILIHAVNAVLVYIFFRRFLGSVRAGVLGLLFGIHPINSEAVAYIAIANDPLYFFFGMTGLILVMNRAYLSAAAALFLSLVSKESGLVFIAGSVLYTALLEPRRLRAVLSVCASAVFAYAVCRFGIARASAAGTVRAFPMEYLSLYSRLSFIPGMLLFYVSTYVFPYTLAIGRQWASRPPDAGTIILGAISIVFLVAGMWRMTAAVTDSRRRTAAVFFLSFAVAGLLPYMQAVPLSMTVGERWFLVAQIGLSGWVAVVMPRLPAQYAVPVTAMVLLFLSVRTYIRTLDWRSDAVFFRREVHTLPDSYMILTGMGTVFLSEGMPEQAEQYFARSAAVFPHDPNAWISLGIIEEAKGNKAAALMYYRKSVSDAYTTRFAQEKILQLAAPL